MNDYAVDRIDVNCYDRDLFDRTVNDITSKYDCTVHIQRNVKLANLWDITKGFGLHLHNAFVLDGDYNVEFYELLKSKCDLLMQNSIHAQIDTERLMVDADYHDAFRNIFDLWEMYNTFNNVSYMPVCIAKQDDTATLHPGNTRLAMSQQHKFRDIRANVIWIDYDKKLPHNISFDDFPYGVQVTEYPNKRFRRLEFYATTEFHTNFTFEFNKDIQLKFTSNKLWANGYPIVKFSTSPSTDVYFYETLRLSKDAILVKHDPQAPLVPLVAINNNDGDKTT